MSERLTIKNQEISAENVNETIRAFEDQFVAERIAKTAVAGVIFGEQLMEEHDIKGQIAVATHGPTWTGTGMTRDSDDGDKGGGVNHF
jgi:hypothetical protein